MPDTQLITSSHGSAVDELVVDEGSPFHAGEVHVQQKFGVTSIDAWARKVVRPYLTDQHKEFFCDLPFTVLSARDLDGCTHVTVVCGEVTTPTDTTLRFSKLNLVGDPLANRLIGGNIGARVGMLGIMLHNKRRNRVNGRVSASGDTWFEVTVDQAFGNCPQYIKPRQWQTRHRETINAHTSANSNKDGSTHGPQTRLSETPRTLRDDSVRIVREADTFFIGSGIGDDSNRKPQTGMDASHRGGPPGFVRVAVSCSKQILSFDDYSGNNHFNTIGNLITDPRVGLVFVEFSTGTVVHVVGMATVEFIDDADVGIDRTQRRVHVEVEQVIHRTNALALRWATLEQSRTLAISAVVDETTDGDIKSFYLVDTQGREERLEPYTAGQYLTIQVPTDTGAHSENHESRTEVTRTYSLSGDASNPYRYRITVRRVADGTVSRLLHDHYNVGDTLLMTSPPTGDFTMHGIPADAPVMFLAAGVGVTPLLPMVLGLTRRANPEVLKASLFVHGVRSLHQRPLGEEVDRACASAGMRSVVRQSEAHERLDEEYATTELLPQLLQNTKSHVFACGPPGFLAMLDAVFKTHVGNRFHAETFNQKV